MVAVSLIGGGNRSTWRKLPTYRKSLTNFIEYNWNWWDSNSLRLHSYKSNSGGTINSFQDFVGHVHVSPQDIYIYRYFGVKRLWWSWGSHGHNHIVVGFITMQSEWVRIPPIPVVLDKVCQWLAVGMACEDEWLFSVFVCLFVWELLYSKLPYLRWANTWGVIIRGEGYDI
jgi:hypothetical protein